MRVDGRIRFEYVRVDGEIFESGKKVADSKISGKVWTGPYTRKNVKIIMEHN